MEDRPPQLDAELVRQFVIAGHGNVAQLKALFNEHPTLVNARYDWGGGDWESALEGAAHTGCVECAEFLLANGARINLFAAAMLGKRAIVAALLEDDPALATAKGAHGIPLVFHAHKGNQPEIVALIEANQPDSGG